MRTSSRPWSCPALAVLLALVLTACAMPGGGGAAGPPSGIVTATGSASGDAAGPVVKVLGIQVNALVRYHGEVRYTIQDHPPYVTLDGDYTIVVEPMPGLEAEAQAAVVRGDLLIRRAGQPGHLNAPGSIRALKAARAGLYAPRPAAPAPPPPPPPPPPPAEPAPAPAPMTDKPAGATFCAPDDPSCNVPTSTASR